MGYLKFIDTDGSVKDVSELSFADTVETISALGQLEKSHGIYFYCAYCAKDVTGNLCEHLSNWR